MVSKIDEYITLSNELRNKYGESLGSELDGWKNKIKKISPRIPELYEVIYGQYSGTKRDIAEQRLFDFIPGYRLIHISEIIQEYDIVKNIVEEDDDINILLPLVANYSSDYICYAQKKDESEIIVSISHDDAIPRMMHESIKLFWKTINEFYLSGVYFLDEDGYLDYEFEKEGIIGKKINNGVGYWCE